MSIKVSEAAQEKIGGKALEQEATRVFRRLSETSAYIAKTGGYLAQKQEYGVFVQGNDFKNQVMKVSSSILSGFMAQDWVRQQGAEKWFLTQQGGAWYRRKMAENDPFRSQHQIVGSKEIGITEARKTKVTVNHAESPLGWLLYRKGANGKPLLSQEQYDAGERMRSDFERAQMAPSITADLSRAMGGSTSRRAGNASSIMSIGESALAAKERFFKALDAVGPDLSDVLVEVCCYVKGMEEAEKQLHLPQRSGKVVLQIALTRLALHYGFIVSEKSGWSSKPAFRHWGGDGFRPKM